MTKILVIDDEASLRGSIAEMLTTEGYDVICAADGVEGVNSAIRYQPDLIVCDVSMPRLDGYGVLLDVRADSNTQFVPFIFLTAKAELSEIRAGMELGADNYLTKPFNLLDLLRAVQTSLHKKAAYDEEQQEQISLFKEVLTHEREQRMFKEKLVAMFSDGFRYPLASILTSNSILRDYSDRMDDEHRQTHFSRIEASAHQLQQLLDDLLLVAQMESGDLQFKPEPLDIRQLLESIVMEFQAIYGRAFRFEDDSQATEVVSADPRLLRQIAVNLIDNAIQYSHQETPVDVILTGDDQQYILIVQDQGTGISEADQRRMLTGLNGGSNGAATADAGLGLVIVKKAVDMSGGSVQFESRVGSGTKVTVSLPVL